MTGSYRPLTLICLISFCKNLALWQPFISQVVIAKIARLIRVIQNDEPPATGRRIDSLFKIRKVGINSPYGAEMLMYLPLEVSSRQAAHGISRTMVYTPSNSNPAKSKTRR
jgi:hypothetical protein